MVKIPTDDRFSIQELTHKYAYYADIKDWQAVLDLFIDDCVFDETALGVPKMVGKEMVRAYYAGDLIKSVDYFIHFVTNHIIDEYTGDYARGLCYVFGTGKMKDGTELKVLGYKKDEYVKRSGQWRFKTRVLVLFTNPGGLEL